MTREEAIKGLTSLLEVRRRWDDMQTMKDEIECLEMAIKALEQRWIPVSERLPEEDGEYLCTVQTHDIDTDNVIDEYINFCDFIDSGWCVFDDETVVAWMPLPEPYREESEEV